MTKIIIKYEMYYTKTGKRQMRNEGCLSKVNLVVSVGS
jgi:hypothetical protein